MAVPGSPTASGRLFLSVALDGLGWHPAAWRVGTDDVRTLFGAAYWTDLARRAESAAIDFVTLEDGVGIQSGNPLELDERTDQVRGRLDAVLLANRIAPVTTNLALVPTATVTHTEPFHVSTGIATLDFVSEGRAGWRPQVSARPVDAALFGRREVEPLLQAGPGSLYHERVLREVFDEAADAVEVVRRLWDSWEDEAVIRDVPTGRFVDREKLHYIDFQGERFSVKGPSITPRPPQGQPPVVALAHARIPYEFAARAADVVLVTPQDAADARRIVAEVRQAEEAVGRTLPPLLVLADVLALLDDDETTARARLDELDALDGAALTSDAAIRATTAESLAAELLSWREAGVAGFRLRPARLPEDLARITRDVVPALVRAGVYREHYGESTLRERLRLNRPASRYAAAR